MNERLFGYSWASVHPLYVPKVQKRGRPLAELNGVIGWLPGYDEARLAEAVETIKRSA